MPSEKEGSLYLKVELKGDVKRRFDLLKEKLGMESNSDIVRFLISREYDRAFGSAQP